MESSEVYHIKQQFTLGAYPALAQQDMPDPNSPDYNHALLYKARALIALGKTSEATGLIPTETESSALKAVSAFSQYITSPGDESLEPLRDLAVEVEGDDGEGEPWEKDAVRLIAATAFVRAEELEEALETLSTATSDEAIALKILIYLSISRPQSARKSLLTPLQQNPDSLPLQLSEAMLLLFYPGSHASSSLSGSADPYNSSMSFYTEHLASPSITSHRLLTARSLIRLARGEISAAKSDIEEALATSGANDPEALAASIVALALGGAKRAEIDEAFEKLVQADPEYPMVKDTKEKADLFDSCAAKYTVPAVAGRA